MYLLQSIGLVLGIALSAIGIYKFFLENLGKKLEIKITRKEWINYAVQSSTFQVEPEPDIRLDTDIIINNKLGKDTSLIDIRLERQDFEPIILNNSTAIPKDRSYRFHHIWELGDTSIKGRLIVNHTHGDSSIPINEKISIPVEEIPKRGMQIEFGKRP